MTYTEIRLQESIFRAQHAWRLGHTAEDAGRYRSDNPYPDEPGSRMEREAWFRGFGHSAIERNPAEE